MKIIEDILTNNKTGCSRVDNVQQILLFIWYIIKKEEIKNALKYMDYLQNRNPCPTP